MAAPVSLFSQVGQLEDRLAFNPRARRQAGIVLVAAGAERKRPNLEIGRSYSGCRPVTNSFRRARGWICP
jgi:hypothetical protein